MLGSIATPICAVAEESEAVEMQDGEMQDDGILEYVALGDSISNGYSADPESEIISYPQLIAHDLEEMAGEDVELSKDTKNGLTTTKLNSVILKRKQVQESLQKADFVTVTIGANDLMNQFKKVSKEILNNNTRFSTANQALAALQDGIKANPLLLVKVVSAISNWDYTSFEDDWKLTMENIDSMRPANSEMIVTTIYNPVESMELPGTLNSIVEGLISKMNDIIVSYADDYDYKVVPGPRVLQEGDIVSIDVGAYIGGYHGDCAATFPCGKVSPEAQNLIDVTRQSFFEGIKFAKEGCRLYDISAAIQGYAESHGCSIVREYVGHGIGTEMHESPEIPNYGHPGRGPRLLRGMTIAVEPMVNAGTAAIRQMPDGWTVRTADGKLAAHYENTLLITDGEPEILTAPAI